MPDMKEKWVEIIVITPPEMSDALANFLDELGTNGVFQEESPDDFSGTISVQKEQTIKAYLPAGRGTKERLEHLQTYIDSLSEIFPKRRKPAFTTHRIVDPNWGEEWKKYFKPLRISKNIIIKPTWERYTPTGRDIVIDIDPGMAFGTGQHPSTEMCITALEDIFQKDRSFNTWEVLDVGTGTGILAICAVKLGADHVTAIDIDPKAIEITEINAAINEVQDKIDVENRDIALFTGNYNIITANLTSSTLITIHAHLMPMLAAGGYLIASGIIEQDKDTIEKLFREKDVVIHEMRQQEEWVCYVFKKEYS